MKKILIYTISNGNFVDTLYHALGEGFRKIGREVVYCDVDSQEFMTRLTRIITEEDIDFSVGHNEFGAICANRDDSLRNFYKSREHVAILDDAPYNTVTSKTFFLECPRLLIAYRDRSHLDYLKSIRMKRRVLGYFFLPFGALMDKRMDSAVPKDIDVVFSGMYYGVAVRSWKTPKIEPVIQTILDYAANILETEAVCVDDAISRVIGEFRLNIDKQIFYPAYRHLYEYTKKYRRNRLVGVLANSGVELTVCSDTWKNSEVSDKLKYIHANSTDEVFGIYRRSKVLLQDMAEFNDGSHCRIGDGPLCNTMVVSEASKFLLEKFNNSGIFFFSWDNLMNLPPIISKFCKMDKMRNSFVDLSCEKVLDEFLPEHGAAAILAAVDAARQGKRGPD